MTLCKNKAARIIQNAFRRYWQTLQFINEHDVFTLDSPIEPPIFRIKTGNRRYSFNCKTLLRYMMHSGKYENPFTRERLVSKDLFSLYNQYNYYFPQDKLVSRHHNPPEFYIWEINKLFKSLLEIILNTNNNNAGSASHLFTQIIPELTDDITALYSYSCDMTRIQLKLMRQQLPHQIDKDPLLQQLFLWLQSFIKLL